ncbi:unnamed protein product [Dibothriocephalus latus]|uniref:RRM domain-containing protein n=1 Tax=Dibothriocephalus latus TaxID=60516 RepID=A0A3P7P3C4_DIBLA|nr:unnamed protein product [Dibothriocephalus latus]
MHPTTNTHNGNAYIMLDPTADGNTLRAMGSVICGDRINVKEICFVAVAEKKLSRERLQEVTTDQNSLAERKRRKEERARRKLVLKTHRDIARSQKAVDLYVDGVGSKMTKKRLSTHFASFGEVLDVHMEMDYWNKKPGGHAYIAMQPTIDPKQIRWMEHIVNGVTIRVRKCTSFREVGKKLGRTEGDLDPEPLLPKPILGTRKQKAPKPAKLAHQPPQQRKRERKGQINREKKKQEKIQRQLQRLKQAQKQNQKRKQRQQHGLQEHRSVGRPQKSLRLFVSGTKEAIIPDIVKAYFSRFGEVLDMNFPINCSREKHRGSCYIKLQPTSNAANIFDREHFLCRSRITAVECYSPENAEIEAVGYVSGRFYCFCLIPLMPSVYLPS